MGSVCSVEKNGKYSKDNEDESRLEGSTRDNENQINRVQSTQLTSAPFKRRFKPYFSPFELQELKGSKKQNLS